MVERARAPEAGCPGSESRPTHFPGGWKLGISASFVQRADTTCSVSCCGIRVVPTPRFVSGRGGARLPGLEPQPRYLS